MNRYPDMVWFIEDASDSIQSIRKILKAKKGEENFDRLQVFDTVKEVEELLKKKETIPPDVLLLDICLKPGEDALVICKKDSFKKINNLARVSGIDFLNWLRCYFPLIPVVISSGYWEKKPNLPDLSQHAICIISKPVKPYISNILWIAQQVIIGINIPKELREEAKIIIEKVNAEQNHFHFIVCEKEEDLSSPPADLAVELKEEELVIIFGAWNNRVLGLLEDETLKKDERLRGVLPFGRFPLRRFSISLNKDVEWMGKNYLGAFLLRECARAAYLLFFNIKPHPVNTGECIFDSSSFTPDLIKGIKRSEPCTECQAQMKPHYALGGWSRGRGEAVKKIIEMAKREYEKAQKDDLGKLGKTFQGGDII